MTVYISPNPGKAMAYGISQRAAQILLTHGAQVLMHDGLQAECMTMGVVYLSQKECLERTDPDHRRRWHHPARGESLTGIPKAHSRHQSGPVRLSGYL